MSAEELRSPASSAAPSIESAPVFDAEVESDDAPAKQDQDLWELHGIIERKSVIRDLKGEVFSPRGSPQNWLVDLRATILDSRGLEIVVDRFWRMFDAKLPFQVCGLETASIPMVAAIVLRGQQRGTPVNGFIIRKERKPYGLARTIEGDLTDAPIIVVDDLINSGSSLEKVRVALENCKRRIERVFAIIDFEARAGRRWKKRNGVSVTSLFTLDQFGLSSRRRQVEEPLREFYTVWRSLSAGGSYFDVTPRSAPAIDEQRIYFGSDSGKFVALDQETGYEAWSFSIATKNRKRIWSSPAILDDRVIFGAYDGNLYALDRHTGKELWRRDHSDWIGSSPCIIPDLGLIVVGLEHEAPARKGSLIACRADSGEVMWETEVREYLHGSAAYHPEHRAVAIGTNDKDLLFCEVETGIIRWRFRSGGAIKYAPAFDFRRNTVIFGGHDGFIRIVRLEDGRECWSWGTQGTIYSTPLIHENRAYIGSSDKHFYVLDLEQRQLVGKVYLEAKILSSPKLFEGSIWLGTTAGTIFEIALASLSVVGRHQLPERVTNAICYSERTKRFFAATYDGSAFCFARASVLATGGPAGGDGAATESSGEVSGREVRIDATSAGSIAMADPTEGSLLRGLDNVDDKPNPILIGYRSQGRISQTHRGVVIASEPDGTTILEKGDALGPNPIDSLGYLFETLFFAASGAVEAFGLGDRELALAAGVHTGRSMHVDVLAAWLRRLSLTDADLACLPSPPLSKSAAAALKKSRTAPTPIHNAKSGAHLRWLTLARHVGAPIRNYISADHIVQIEMRQNFNKLAEYDVDWGAVKPRSDKLPAVSMPLTIAATLLARIADPASLPLDLAPAARRITAAVAAQPEFVAGPRRFNSVLAIETHGDVLSFGSNGCYGALIRRRNLGMVVRIDDGDDDSARLVLMNNLREIGAVDSKTQRSITTATIATPN